MAFILHRRRHDKWAKRQLCPTSIEEFLRNGNDAVTITLDGNWPVWFDGSMTTNTLLQKRVEVPERWLAAFLFSFKLLTLIGAGLFFIWHLLLPSNHPNWQTGIDMKWCIASEDFATIATNISVLYFITTGLLMVGGLIQLFKHSRQAAVWNFAFSIFALVVGIILACVSYPNGHYEILRDAA